MILYYLLFLVISCYLKVSSEFRAGDGGGDGHVQQVVKDVADYVTASCDEDGLVEVIKKFVL